MALFLFCLYSFVVLICQSKAILSHCEQTSICHLNTDSQMVICDTAFANENQSNAIPALSCFPPVTSYVFRNFHRIQSHAFENFTFLANKNFLIKLTNISNIESEVFTDSINLPENSKLTIEIEHVNSSASITWHSNVFNRIRIDQLRFSGLNHFNGRSVFDTICFGNDVKIDELRFEHCNITGFSNTMRKAADVKHLAIKHSMGLTQLTDQSLPSFVSTLQSLEISNTSLRIINAHTFQAWSLVLEELIISHNHDLEVFPSNIVDGVLMRLNKLDLSYNSINTLPMDYNWFPYSYTKHLLLKNQRIDLFLKSNILQTLSQLQTVDLSHGLVTDDNEHLFGTYFRNMSNLISIDLSYVNLTETMLIDLLTSLSRTASHFLDIRLFGQTLTDDHFCSYFTIFKNAPSLLNLQLDDFHECNCVVDLFYTDNVHRSVSDHSDLQPSCLSNSTRNRCHIQTQLERSKCSVGSLNPDQPTAGDRNAGKYAFAGMITGLTIVVMVLVSLGFGAVYRVRRRRRNTELVMDQPVENPLAAVIEERLQKA